MSVGVQISVDLFVGEKQCHPKGHKGPLGERMATKCFTTDIST